MRTRRKRKAARPRTARAHATPRCSRPSIGRTWYFGMKVHVGVDAESGLVHTVIGTAANMHDINATHALLHGEETDVYADAGYQGIERREQMGSARWHVAMRPSKRRKLNLNNPVDAIYDKIERLKAGIRAKVEHPFRILKRQFGYMKTRYRGGGEEHRSDHDVICVGQFMDDA